MKKTEKKNAEPQTGLSTGMRNLARDQRGLTTVEYIIVLVLIAIAAIGIWTAFGEAVIERVDESMGEIQGM